MRALLAFAPLVLLSACSSGQSTTGSGGFAAVSSSASTSGGGGQGGAPADAGPDAQPVCGRCRDALLGPDHLEHELRLCPGTDAGDAWRAYVKCGCENLGPCYTACAASAYCAGVTPAPGPWADPIGTCKGCLESPGPNGCEPEALACLKT